MQKPEEIKKEEALTDDICWKECYNTNSLGMKYGYYEAVKVLQKLPYVKPSQTKNNKYT